MDRTGRGMDYEQAKHILSNGQGDPLSRQITVTLSPEHYERLFFQPSAPQAGDLSKRFANPTLLGLLAFLIPYTSTILILCGFQGAEAPYSLIGLDGDYYFLGAIAMNVAGIAEFILGNTFPFAVFVIYGCHWGSLAYMQDPLHNQVAGVAAAGGATGVVWNSSQGFHNITMALVSFVFLIATIRVNAFFTLTFIGLIGLFSFTAVAQFAIPHATTADDLAHITTMIHFAGGFGFIGLVCGWYLAIITSCAAVGIPCPLPIFDLSQIVFAEHNRAKKAHDLHNA